MTCGSGIVGLEYASKAAGSAAEQISLSDYFSTLSFRSVDLMAKEPKAHQATLPQIGSGLAGPELHAAPQSTEDQIDDFVKDSPQLRQMVQQDRAESNKRRWVGLFRKAVTDAAPRTNRLAAIRERNFPTPKAPRPELDPSALSGMSAIGIYTNRAAISEGFRNRVINGINATKNHRYR